MATAWRNLLIRASGLGPLGRVTLALVIYSLGIHAWAFFAGVYFDADLADAPVFAGYLGKINWSLAPLWWLLLAVAIYLCWDPFMAAWRDVHAKGMLLDRDGEAAAEQQVTAFYRRLGRYRAGLVIPAVAISCVITFFDTADLRTIYRGCTDQGADFKILLSRAGSGNVTTPCSELADNALRDLPQACTAVKFRIVPDSPVPSGVEVDESQCGDAAARLGGSLEVDFSIAYLLHEPSSGRVGPIELEHNRWLNWAIYLQQIALGAMAIFGLFQLVLQCNLFWRLESAAWLNREGLRLVMDPYSKLHEFGLESWNHALNNLYWVFAAVLLLPLASRHSQSGEGLDFGQILLQIGVPAIIALPMLATIIARQQRQRELWPRIQAEEDPARVELYHRQLLWPLDRNWASKLGIVLSFVMLSYLLGKNLLSLAG